MASNLDGWRELTDDGWMTWMTVDGRMIEVRLDGMLDGNFGMDGMDVI